MHAPERGTPVRRRGGDRRRAARRPAAGVGPPLVADRALLPTGAPGPGQPGDQQRHHQAGQRRHRERGADAVGLRERRHHECRCGDPERLPHLADAHGDAPLPHPEPAHHQASARGVDGGAGCADQGEREAASCGLRCGGAGQGDRSGEREARCQHGPLAVPVGEDAPEDQGEHEPDRRCGGQRTGLGQRQAVGAAQRGEQEGEPEHQRGRHGLGRGAQTQHQPAPGVLHPSMLGRIVRGARPASRHTRRRGSVPATGGRTATRGSPRGVASTSSAPAALRAASSLAPVATPRA